MVWELDRNLQNTCKVCQNRISGLENFYSNRIKCKTPFNECIPVAKFPILLMNYLEVKLESY